MEEDCRNKGKEQKKWKLRILQLLPSLTSSSSESWARLSRRIVLMVIVGESVVLCNSRCSAPFRINYVSLIHRPPSCLLFKKITASWVYYNSARLLIAVI